jgi:ketosteroid isomerase-like protein
MRTILLTISVIFLLLVGTPFYSQMVVQKLSAATPTHPSLIATEEEVRRFFDQYVERYNQRDLDGFLLFFSLKTIQNQQDGLPEIKKLYADVFNRSQKLQISIEDIKIEIYQNAVDVKARYTVDQVLKETGGKRYWKGNIHWVLVKEEGTLKITSIDFRHSVPPALALEGKPKTKEKPAGKALVKPEVPVGVKKASPQAAPLLAEEEEVKRFFSNYIDRYHKKDIDGFLSFFSSKALQNQKDGLKEIRKIYTKFFDQSQELRYHVKGMKIKIYQNAVDVKARFRVDQRLKKRGEEIVWEGNVRWVLVKEDGNLKISSLDYQNEKIP